MSLNGLVGLSELFLAGFLSGLVFRAWTKPAQDLSHSRSKAPFFDPLFSIVLVLILAGARLSELTGWSCVWSIRLIVLAALLTGPRLYLLQDTARERGLLKAVFIINILSCLLILLPVELVFKSSYRLSASGLIEPERTIFFSLCLINGLFFPLVRLLDDLKSRVFNAKTGFALTSAFAIFFILGDLSPSYELVALAWLLLALKSESLA